MKKYYFGIIVIALISAGLIGFTVVKGVAGRIDKTTDKRSREIAKDLNSYISKNRQIPESLDDAGIKDVPSTIEYKKIDSSVYEFCVTYKEASSYGGSGLTDVLTGSALSSYNQQDTEIDIYQDEYTPSTLYISYYHKKGRQCQKVKPYVYDDYYDYNYDYDYDSQYPSINKSSQDTERQTDIKAIHAQLEVFYAENGYYPSFAQLSNSTFRSSNLKGLDEEALKDPSGKSTLIVKTPITGYYSYDVKATGTAVCDNDTTTCTSYTLTATLSTGKTYEKQSLN